jgi:phosphatidylcholine synthase
MIKVVPRRLRRVRGRKGKAVPQALAWGVHLYTALGLVAAAGIGVLTVQGGPEAFRAAFVLMLVAIFIDGTDGTLARRVKVKEVLPGFDGRRLDDIVDFLTYTCLPLLLIWRAGILSGDNSWWLLLPLLASAYGFCQVAAKTDDGYFLGFPSYWNLVAFYLYALRPPEWVSVVLLGSLALLTFVPARYLYPSQRGRLNAWTTVLGALWGCLLIWILMDPSPVPLSNDRTRWAAAVSLFFPVYYLVASWVVTLRFWLRRRPGPRPEMLALSLETKPH